MYTVTFRFNVQSMKRSVDNRPPPDTNSKSNDSESSCGNSCSSGTRLKSLQEIISNIFSRIRRLLKMTLAKFKMHSKNADETTMQQRNVTLKPVTFHEKHGRNVRLWINKQIAFRSYDYCDGYVFMREPVAGNRFFLVVQILESDPSLLGSLAFGMTTANPDSIPLESLPSDSKHLHDGRSHLVRSNVTKSSTGDTILIFYPNDSYEMKVKGNNHQEETLFSIKRDTSYWCFFDVFGSTRKIRAYLAEKSEVDLLGLLTQQPELIDDRESLSRVAEIETEETNSDSDNNSPTLTLKCCITSKRISYEPVSADLHLVEQLKDPSVGFCVECFKNYCDDCILYPCGDTILCYKCAQALQRDNREAGRCPKCLSIIKKVTRIFKA